MAIARWQNVSREWYALRKYLARTRHDYMTSEPRFYFQMQLDIQVVTFLFKDSEIVSDVSRTPTGMYCT